MQEDKFPCPCLHLNAIVETEENTDHPQIEFCVPALLSRKLHISEQFPDSALSRHKTCPQFLMLLVIQAYDRHLPQSFQDLRHFVLGKFSLPAVNSSLCPTFDDVAFTSDTAVRTLN